MKQQDLFSSPSGVSPAKPAARTPEPVAAPPPAALAPLAPPAAPVSTTQPAWRRTPVVAARPWSVSQLTAQIKELLEPNLQRVLVRGEVSGFRGPNQRGHLYFSIKDANAAIEVRVWQSTARALKFALREGLSVMIEGSVNVYEPSGRYSLIVQRIEPEGIGAQALALEQLKQRLMAEGLLGEGRTRPRRPLPFLPRRIGVVTSVTGAALRDFLKVLHRRHPRLAVLVANARVQGDGASIEVRHALKALERTDVDVIVVTRGGGSAEDLWAFNEEGLARAIFECRVPVVSAVGHEIDTTLADLVADVRAPTPSAAAELLAPVLLELEAELAGLKARGARAVSKLVAARRAELKSRRSALGDPRRTLANRRLGLDAQADRITTRTRLMLRARLQVLQGLAVRLQRARPQAQLKHRTEALGALRARLESAMARQLVELRRRLGVLAVSVERRSPRPRLAGARMQLGELARRLPAVAQRRLATEREAVARLGGSLDALSPLKVLGRGYALVQTVDRRLVRSAADVRVGDAVQVRVGEGDELSAQVTAVRPFSSR